MEVRIEISKNSNIKYEYDEEKNCLILDRVLPNSNSFPYNYGYIPNTLADDGDPVDVLIINDVPFYPNSFCKCKVLGMLITEDESGMDQKVIALPVSKIDRQHDDINDITDVNENTLKIIKDFFENYKNNESGKWVKCGDYKSKEETIEFIKQKTTK